MHLQFTGSSEDCLNLNVFRPAGISDSASLPVMVWIYGGGFMEGHTIEYNATQIIIQSVLRVRRFFHSLHLSAVSTEV